MKASAAPLPARDIAALALIATIWGLNTVLTKVVVDEVPPLATLVARFAITLAVLLPVMRPIGPNWKAMLLVCLLTGPLHFGLQFPGLALAHDLAPMVIAMQLWIPCSVLFAMLFLGERPGRKRLAGLAISFTGIVVLAVEPTVLDQIGAFALVAAASAAYAGASVLMRKVGGLDPLQAQAWLALVCLPVLGAGSVVTEQGQWAALMAAGPLLWAYIAIGALASGVLANAWMWTILQRAEVGRTTPFLLVSPLVALVLGVAFLGDPVTWQGALGVAIAMAGIMMSAR